MKLVLNGFRLPLGKARTDLSFLVAKELDLPPVAVKDLKVLRESIDARKKFSLAFVYNLELDIEASPKQLKRALKLNASLQEKVEKQPRILSTGLLPLRNRPVVIGSGPAGYFAAITLARYGYAPLLLERGDDVDTRTSKINNFWDKAELDPESNVQFGEGGAGTFSDGKLTTRISDDRIAMVLETFVKNGAPEEILYKHKPHVGTDKLRIVVKGLRSEVESLGGEVRFRSKVTGFRIEQGKLVGVEINGQQEFPAEAVVLAIGHSARDTYAMLNDLEISMEAKPFSIGLRVEHPQGLIDQAQFGEFAEHPKLGAADYQLTYQDSETGRAAYAFCMCPGGKVVAATSEKNQVVTNGMSEFARDTGVANSALVVSVNPDDFGTSYDCLGGIEFQRTWERQAFKSGGSNYRAPAQAVEDFLKDRISSKLELDSSYLPGVELANLKDVLPKEVGEVLGRAIENFNTKINGFTSQRATLTGVETRTSAPVRILRDKNLQSLSLAGLYPAGEGAGYAGGIMSAAVDGIRVAEAIISQYIPIRERR
jgi:uncharacterized protein